MGGSYFPSLSFIGCHKDRDGYLKPLKRSEGVIPFHPTWTRCCKMAVGQAFFISKGVYCEGSGLGLEEKPVTKATYVTKALIFGGKFLHAKHCPV